MWSDQNFVDGFVPKLVGAFWWNIWRYYVTKLIYSLRLHTCYLQYMHHKRFRRLVRLLLGMVSFRFLYVVRIGG